MAVKLIYQNPDKERERSSPVDETDVARRRILEAAKWYVVQRIDENGEELPLHDEVAPQEPVGAAVEEAPEVEKAEEPVESAASFFTDLLGLSDAQGQALVEAGFDSIETIENAADDDLLEVPSIGNAALEKIRDALA